MIFLFFVACAHKILPANVKQQQPLPSKIATDETGNLIQSQQEKTSIDLENILPQNFVDSFTLGTSRINSIEIHVLSKKIFVSGVSKSYQNFELEWPAATASPKNAKGVPYDRVGRIWKVTFNPIWYPPQSIKDEFFSETGEVLSAKIFPGKSNPLGKFKLYIEFDWGSEWGNSTYGLHGTNVPNSVGKRVTHGCTRLSEDAGIEIIKTILVQNGHDFEKISHEALKNPSKPIDIILEVKPSVVHLKK